MSQTRLFVTGKMGSGKDRAVNYLLERYDAQLWTRSELMKKLCHAVVDQVGDMEELLARVFPNAAERARVREDLLAYEYEEPEPGKPRRLYQDIPEICQEYDPLCFERELYERIRASATDDQFVVIEGVRKLSAFEFFAGCGYRSARIEAPENVRLARLLDRDGFLPDEETFAHPSETELDAVKHDFVIDNSTDAPEPLHAQLDQLVLDLGLAAGHDPVPAAAN